MKPWKIALAAMGGIAVIGGIAAGIGITIAHNHRMENALESMSARVEELLEQATETSEEAETTTAESTTASNSDTQAPAKAPETVVVYVEPSTQPPITWTYDEKLSREVAQLMGKKFPDAIYDESLYRDDIHPENVINPITYKINHSNLNSWFTGTQTTAQDIVNAWTECDLYARHRREKKYFIQIYRFSNGWVQAYVN